MNINAISGAHKLPPARKTWLKVNGKPAYRVIVVIQQSGLDHEYWEHRQTHDVIAASVTEAVNYVRNLIAPHVSHPTEVFARGPKNGIIHRFIGWESIISAQMFQVRNPETPNLL